MFFKNLNKWIFYISKTLKLFPNNTYVDKQVNQDIEKCYPHKKGIPIKRKCCYKKEEK
jgi:hypothetical protein